MVTYLFHAMLVVLTLASAVSAQATSATNHAPRYDEYDVTQYVSCRGLGPANVMRLDNNGDLVLACRGGKTREQLRSAGIEFSESQLVLLECYRIIKTTGDTTRTVVPFLDEAETSKLRELTKSLAAGIVPVIRNDIIDFRDYMRSIGLENNTYSIVFSLALDGLIWDVLRERNLVAGTSITSEKPFWNGVVWGVYPPRKFSPGTNSRSNGTMMLAVNWSDDSWPLIRPYWSQRVYFDSLFNDYLDDGTIASVSTREFFAPLKIIDSNGRITLPIIAESPSDPIYHRCRVFTEKVADEFLARVELANIASEFGLVDNNEAVVILYHDLMWDILDVLEKDDLVERPLAFSQPVDAPPESIADLMFIVTSK